ncbi:MAG TPA: hypothetical protein VLE97_07335 [Gaiellaceae bacterium]|nr:hypothetical protein [Gaiellaceae bacterium]
MTPAQQAREQASIEKFVDAAVRKVRPRGTNVAVTHVLVAAAYAAANSAARTSTGAIDEAQAHTIFRGAARLMRAERSRKATRHAR